MISLKGVGKNFGKKQALSQLTFDANPGEVIGFLGPNGAGKTTTMRLILGYLAPSEGTITVNGMDPIGKRLQVLRQIGYLPENNPLYMEMRVGKYLEFVAHIKEAELGDIPTLVGLDDVMISKIEELSRGYKQRVGLAASLIGNPPILVLDEPTSGLDPLEQEKIKKLIKRIAKNKTIIFSTHILSEVEDIATKLVIIDKGNIVYKGIKPPGRGGVEKLFKKMVKA